jgi:hypothetical protein
MSDDKSNVGKADRDRVSAEEDYEVQHLAQKFDLPVDLVQKAIAQTGPMRADVEKQLSAMKGAGAR